MANNLSDVLCIELFDALNNALKQEILKEMKFKNSNIIF